MTALLLAFLTALFESFKDLFTKFNLRHIDVYSVAWSTHLIQSLLFIPPLFFYEFKPPTPLFLGVLALAAGIQFTVVLLYMHAIRLSELSLTVPLIALTPMFMLITSPIILGEFPTAMGMAGIVLIVVGTYVLNFSKTDRSPLAPFRNLYTNKGSRYMLIVAFLWSITANIDKIGVIESSPVHWAFAKDFIIMLMLFPLMLWKSKSPFPQIKSRIFSLSVIGVFRAGSVLAQMIAIQFILVSYVIAIKRTSALFVLFLGFLFLKEKASFKSRIAGVVIILTGLAFIVFGR